MFFERIAEQKTDVEMKWEFLNSPGGRRGALNLGDEYKKETNITQNRTLKVFIEKLYFLSDIILRSLVVGFLSSWNNLLAA